MLARLLMKKQRGATDTARISFRITQEGTEDRFFNCAFESCQKAIGTTPISASRPLFEPGIAIVSPSRRIVLNFSAPLCGAIEKNCNRIGVFFQLAIVERPDMERWASNRVLSRSATRFIHPPPTPFPRPPRVPPPLPPCSVPNQLAYREKSISPFFPPARQIRRQHHRRFHCPQSKQKFTDTIDPLSFQPYGHIVAFYSHKVFGSFTR